MRTVTVVLLKPWFELFPHILQKLELDRFMLYAHGPDLCRESDLRHAMANCFEALIGKACVCVCAGSYVLICLRAMLTVMEEMWVHVE